MRKTVIAALVGFLAAGAAQADPSVIDLWGQVTPPPVPTLKAVTVDPATTALLVLDENGAQDPAKGPCNSVNKPRCIAAIPVVQKLIADARANHVFVVYSITKSGTPADIATALAPQGGDPVVQSGADKFVGTKLADILSDHKIKTVIAIGTASEGAVLQTVSDAVLREKLKAVVAVDGMTSTNIYGEQAVVWTFLNAPGLAGNVTVTQTGMISY